MATKISFDYSGIDSRDGKYKKVMHVSGDECAFILGKGGRTKYKVAAVADVELTMDKDEITIEGKQRVNVERAIKYVQCLNIQRMGKSVKIEQDLDHNNDMTALDIPQE